MATLPSNTNTNPATPLTRVTTTLDYKDGAIPLHLTPADLSMPFTRLRKASQLVFLYPASSGTLSFAGWWVSSINVRDLIILFKHNIKLIPLYADD